jgi:hypothetical protein
MSQVEDAPRFHGAEGAKRYLEPRHVAPADAVLEHLDELLNGDALPIPRQETSASAQHSEGALQVAGN